MLNDPYCLRCECDRHLRPDWDVLTQTCKIRSMTDDGRFIYHSDFQLFPLGSIPADFSRYSRAAKGARPMAIHFR